MSSNRQPARSSRRFAIVMVCSFALGIAVALAVYFYWRSHGPDWQPASSAWALVVCPPFILSYVIGAAAEFGFALALGLGTVVLANGFLYAGVAAGIYAVTTFLVTKESA